MEQKLVCGITGKEIEIGDEYLLQSVAPEAEGQRPYLRPVLLSAVSMTEEQVQQARDRNFIIEHGKEPVE